VVLRLYTLLIWVHDKAPWNTDCSKRSQANCA
jgi:hypothetical protein